MIDSTREIADYRPYPRSVLQSAVPLGLGTGQLESMRSYVDRLLFVHRTTTYQFDRFVWLSAGVAAPLCKQHSRRFHDTPSPASAAFASRLAELTLQPSVARLGLGWLHRYIGPNEVLRRQLVWCDLCMLEALEARSTPFLPLLWSLRCVQACSVHRRLFSTCCLSCGWVDRPGSLLAFPFRDCPRCKAPLANPTSSKAKRVEASPGQLFVADLLADFIREIQGVRKEDRLSAPSLFDAADSAIQRGFCSSRSDFARQMGVHSTSFTQALKGGRSSLNFWARVAAVAGLTLAGLLTRRLWRETPIRAVDGHTYVDIPMRPYRRVVDSATVTAEIDAQLASAYPISPMKLAKSLGAYRRHLVDKVGDKVDRLAVAYREGLRRRRDDRVHALAVRLEFEAEALRSQGVKVSARKLANRVGLDCTNVVFTLAVRQAAPKLGAKYADFGRNRVLKRHVQPAEPPRGN